MNLDIGQLIVWLIIGALAGTVATMLFHRARTRWRDLSNIVLGLIGALIGGALFSLLNIRLGLPRLTFSLDDLVAAFIGSVILLVVLRFLRR